jgi:4-hydroxy-3-methylbut-2-enyl diphosphate reductase
VSVAVEAYAAELGLQTIDATCPLVTSVHRMVEKYHKEGDDVLIIGHHNHPEVEGTAGRVPDRVQVIATENEAKTVRIADAQRVGYVTQTTLTKSDISGILDILKERFPRIKGPSSNICFATQNRQDAVKALAERSEIVFVVGSKNSSNSNRLKEVAARCSVSAYLIDDYSDIDTDLLEGVTNIGITAGASAPERLITEVIENLKELGAVEVKEMSGRIENVHFPVTVLPSVHSK